MDANSANSATWQPPFARILRGKRGTGFVQYGIADRSVVSVSIADVHLFLLLVLVLTKLLALVESSPKLNEKPTPV